MTESILTFGLKSTICSGVFVAYYLLALKNARMNSFNRIYLLSSAFLSLVLPFARLDIFDISPVAVPDFPLLAITAKGSEEILTHLAPANSFNWQMLLVPAYFTVSLVLIFQLASKFIWAYRLKSKGQKTKRAGFLLIKTEDPRAPFSFMNMLFWPAHMRQDSPEANNILKHELAHIRQRHTLDKLLMQLMLAACWLNPFNWLIKKEIWLQHEFLADQDAVRDGNTDAFARMLLFSVTNSSDRSILSPFFQSPVNRRLLMLTRSSQSAYSLLRRFLSIPILFTAVVLMLANTKDSAIVSPSPEKIVLVLDAAHGGKDDGGKSIYGRPEKDFTLALCKKLVALSGDYNIEVVTTRDEDVYHTLQERLQISNGTDDAVFLSVHVKKGAAIDSRANIYELGLNPKSKAYSKSILLASSIAGKLKTQKLPVEVVDQGKAFVIRDNRHPALILECGNLDDAGNIALLSDEVRVEALCRNILSGIVDYSARSTTR